MGYAIVHRERGHHGALVYLCINCVHVDDAHISESNVESMEAMGVLSPCI